jgi:translation initiation factor 2B subunit (eIF-2B alpha/beta/delta family)
MIPFFFAGAPLMFPFRCSEITGSFDTAMFTLDFLYKVTRQSKFETVQQLVDTLRYVGKTLTAARPLGVCSLNVLSFYQEFIY